MIRSLLNQRSPSSGRLALTWAFRAWRHGVEPDQIDILPFTVLGNLEQINETQETGLARQLWSDVRKPNRRDRVHFDLTRVHAVPGAHFDMRTRPYSNTTSDFAATNSTA